MKRSSVNIIRRLLFGFGLIISLLIIQDIIRYKNYRSTRDELHHDLHSLRILGLSQELTGTVNELEASYKGIFLAADPVYKDRLKRAKTEYIELSEQLTEITSSNPEYQKSLQVADSLFFLWTENYYQEDREYALPGSPVGEAGTGFNEIAAEVVAGSGLLGEINKIFGEINLKERDSIDQRMAESAQKRNIARYTYVGGVILILLVAFSIGAWLIYSAIKYIKSRNLAELAIKKERTYFEKLFQSVPLGVVLLDSKDRIIEINRGFTELFNYDLSEVKGKRINDLIVPAHLKKEGSSLTCDVARGRTVSVETIRQTKEGRMMDVSIQGQPLGLEEGEFSVIGVYSDITKRKRAEAVLRESEQNLRELNTAKDKFFSIIAHDLRNPFNSLVGMSEILLENVRQKDLDGSGKYARHILQSSRTTYELLTDLLSWASLQTGKFKLKKSKFMLCEVFSRNISLLEESASEKSIEIKMECPEDIGVNADSTVISIVFRNLLSNAIKFTPKGGVIKVTASRLDGEVVVSVKDNGIGMGRGLTNQLFDLDKNTSRPGTEGEPGSGLGLKLCREFVEMHGGRIWAESEEGKGSEFSFSIPAK